MGPGGRRPGDNNRPTTTTPVTHRVPRPLRTSLARSPRALCQLPHGTRPAATNPQITQMSRPLKFPDHGNVMDVRRARYDTRRLRQERQKREAGRQVRRGSKRGPRQGG